MEETQKCPIDHTQLTAFNQYNLQDGIICRTCAKRIGLLGAHQSLKLSQAAKALITVNVARDYIENNKVINYQELLSAFKVENNDITESTKYYQDDTNDESSETDRSYTKGNTATIEKVNKRNTDNNLDTELDQVDSSLASRKKEPIFWKGDGALGFGFGISIGFLIGIINMMFFNIPWLGRIVFLLSWLIIGHSKSLSERGNKFIKSGDNQYDLNKHPAQSTHNLEKDKKTDKQVVYVEEKAPKKPKVSRNVPHCPKCKSTNIQILDNKKKFSVGKTVLGAAAFGVAGASVGAFAGKHGKKYHAVCMQCGKKFLVKL